MKLITAATTAFLLVCSALLALPVQAAPGYHAAYFSESAFLSLSPGQTGQFSVGFTNTGDQPWVKSIATTKSSLHTAAPLDNTTDWSAGWGPTWTAPNVYSEQLSDLVAPNQIGFFVYTVTVPAGATLGAHTFYGRPFVGSTPLEDYGYYQIATIVSSIFQLVISGSNPGTPSVSATPNITGTGAPPSTTVTIAEGSTTLGTGTSAADGSFTVSLTTALSVGAHSLVASATGATSSAVFTYTVSGITPSTSTPAVGSGTLSLARPGAHVMIVTFSKAVNSGPIVASNFKWDSANFPSTPVLQAGSLNVRLAFPSGSLPPVGTHTLDVYGITYQDGTTNSPNPATFTVSTTADTVVPSASSAVAVGPATVDVTFSEPMQTTTYGFSTNAMNTIARYTLNNPDGSAATVGGTTGSGAAITISSITVAQTGADAALFNLTKARLVMTPTPGASVTYSLVLTTIGDPTGNNLVSQTLTFSTSGATAPTVSSVTATQLTMTVVYSRAMQHNATANATATTCAGTGVQIDNKSSYTLQSPMSTALANAATTCFISSDETTVTFTFPASTGYAQASYTYSIAAAADTIGNVISPNPTASSVSASQSQPKLASVAYVSTNAFSVTFSETMNTASTTADTSATNAANYAISGTSGAANGTFGGICSTGTLGVTTSDSKTFTVACTGGIGSWGIVSTNVNTVSVRRTIDSDGSQTFVNSTEALNFTTP